jgi:ketosteroid isomerase-like protein
MAAALLLALVLEGRGLPAAGQAALPLQSDAVTDNVRTARALIAALEHEDPEAIQARLAREVELVLPLAPDGNNDAAHVDRFEGRQAVSTLLWRTFAVYRRIAFTDGVMTPSIDGRVIFVEARGDFVTLDGRSYRNVYLIKLVFDDAGAVTRIEEWTNPVTASLTWGFPLGPHPARPATSAGGGSRAAPPTLRAQRFPY